MPKPSELLTLVSAAKTDKLTIMSANKSAQLSKIKKQYGEDVALALIMKLIKELLIFVLHKSDQWTVEAIGTSAKMLLSTFWMYKVDEITLAIKNGVNGQYGALNSNFVYTTLASWLIAYGADKAAEAEKRNGLDVTPELLTSDVVIDEYREYYKECQSKILAKSQEDEESKDKDKRAKLELLVAVLNIGELRGLVRQLVNDKRPSEEIELVSAKINELTQLTID